HVNYVIDNGVGNPISAVLDGADAALVHLTLLDPLTNATNYSISISGVKDIAGNAMLPATIQFSYYEPGPYDVLINEIMADPTPAVGLAAVEFVELYNRTPYAINIGGWKFSDASTTVTLPPHTIPADSFVVLIANSNKDSLPPGVSALGLSSLPSLNNTSDNLTLQNAAGIVIHKVNYVDDWYNHPVKSDGGWTLELINPQSPCQSTNNWTASNDPSGGTPGRRNSVYNPNATATFSLTGVIVSSPNEITLLFNQNVSPAAAAQVSNFTITPANATLQSSALDTTDFAQVHLYFATPLDVSTLYTVSVNIQNCAGQTLSTNNTYQFAVPQPADEFDVIINEIFPDPTPPVGLPEAEFIELFNRSNKAINLQNWELGKAGASTSAKLPYYLLMPDSFVIITANTNAMLFADYLNVLAVSSFPSLTNTGDNLLLKNNSGTLIHYVPYTDEWYQDENKKDGGWSLEMIDPGNPCYGKGNWQASSHPAGGTPGRKNSVVKFNPDTVLPKLVRAAISGPNTVMIYFSEPLDNGIASDPGKYVVDQNVGSPALALPVPYEYNTVQLEFLQPFSKGIIYTVSVSDVTDCNGNPIGMSNTARFAIPDTAAPGDVIINEILFNPRTGGYDFVELYNLSNKVIDLKQLEILEMDYEYPFSILEKSFLATESYLLFPQEYVVVTAKPENILQYYYCENPFALLAVKGFPNFDDNESICVLRLINNATIDSLAYRDDWHFALLDKEDGVSLERTSFDAPTQQSSSWHSAASTVGFATPTYMNSQFASDGFHDDAITISPEVFTPDNDGDKDFTLIEYQFDEPGYVCNITVFDAIGREIKSLVRNELLSASGKFKWDGTDNEGRKARIGIYIVYAEVFNLQGKVKRFKNQVVLGGKLNE
ncbi:MAG: lamin tail domain-containing protein, partial [Chitinophagales bacterium]|nr:lamin tail domain-containing protein [Chitinophagales bacterium]